ncbi:MAG: hypothetical protein WC055_01940 [Melioribacteraceae bacterium]
MEIITTSVEKFAVAKSALDGLVFWRETENGIEIKLIKCYKKYIPAKLIEFLNTK